MTPLEWIGSVAVVLSGIFTAIFRKYYNPTEQIEDITPKPTPPMPIPTAPTTPTFPEMITKWASLIAIGEGAKPEHNNPGNLKYSTLTASWGATKGASASDGGFLCQFASLQAGQDALCNFLVLGCEDELIAFHTPESRTLEGFTKVYAGNPPAGYIDRIVAGLGVSPTVQISTFLTT